MAMKTILKQPEEKDPQRDPGEKGWAWYYCGREGQLKQNCPQVSKLSRLHVWSAKDHTGRDCPQRCRFQALDSQDNQD